MSKVSDEKLVAMLAATGHALNVGIGGWSYKDNDVTIQDIHSILTELQSLRSASTPAKAVRVHPDDEAVDRFAEAMKAKLAKKRDEGRGGWERKDECSAEFLSKLLREHVEKGDPVDVGNLAMMLQQRGERVIK